MKSLVSSSGCHGRSGWSPIDQRDAVLAQQREDVRGKPALVTELEGVVAGRQVVERGGKALVVTAKFGGSCQRTGPIFGLTASGSRRSQRRCTPCSRSVRRLMWVRRAARVDREEKVVRRAWTQPATASRPGRR